MSVQLCFGNLDSPRGRLQDFRMQEQNKDGQSLYVLLTAIFSCQEWLVSELLLPSQIKAIKSGFWDDNPRRQSLGSVIGIILSSAQVLGQYGVLEDVWRAVILTT